MNPNADASERALALFEMLGSGTRTEISRVAAELATDAEAYGRFRDIFVNAEKALRGAKARTRHQERLRPAASSRPQLVPSIPEAPKENWKY